MLLDLYIEVFTMTNTNTPPYLQPQLAKISDLGLDVECKQPEDLKAAATSLDEVADLVEAIGVEALRY